MTVSAQTHGIASGSDRSTSNATSSTLRVAISTDAPAVSSLISRVWTKHFAYSVSSSDLDHFISTALSPSQIQIDIENPSMRWIVATNLTEIIGVVQLVTGTTEPCLNQPNGIELRRLYVDDSCHGTGLAGLLVSSAEEAAKKEGYRSMWLGAWEDNARGIRFYQKMGFEAVGEHTFTVGDSLRRDHVMEKSI